MSSFSFSSSVVAGAPRNTPARQDLIAALGAGVGSGLSAGPVSKAVSAVASDAPATQSAGPLNVRAGSGKVRYDVGDLQAGGFGNLWGHSRTYLNAEGPGEGSTNGNRWVVDQWWYLHFVDVPPGDNAPARIKLQRGGPGSLWFKPGDLPGDYVPATAFDGNLRHDAGAMTFTHTDAKGRRRVFHDNSTAHPAALRGQLCAVYDAYGNGATLHYDSNDELALVRWTGTGSQGDLSFRYSYDDALAHIGRLRQVVQQVGGRDVARVRYTYWTTGEGGGSANDLKSSQVEEFDATTSTWKTLRREHYRYWLPGQTGGIRSGLKYLVGPETYERLVNGGIDPETAAEAQIAAAADHHLAYQEDRRVVRQSLRGGQDLYQYNYQGNADAPSFGDKNTWAACSEMVLPDGNRKRYYTNRSGGLVLEAREDVALGRTSYQAIQRNADGRMVQKATPAAIGSVVEPGSGSGSLQVNLKPDSGLIYEYGYAAATNPGTGEIKGLPTTRSIRQGASGTAEKVSTLVWTTQTANGVSIHKPSAEIRYTGVMAGSAAARSHSGDARALDEEEEEVSEYQYDYLYYKDAEDNNTFQVLQKTTTLPVIPLSQNGDGQTYTIVERFDEYGHRIWMKNARGYITRWEYVIETGALKRRIEDVDTARLENVPEGWTTPSDGGKHLTYDYESDLQGRIVRELGPPHEAVLKECDRKATVLRSAQFTLHQDALHETWRVAGYATGDAPSYGYETVGAVTIQRRDAAGRLLDTIQARRSCCCGPLQAGEQFPQRQWTRWTKYFYDAWGRVTKTRIYHRIPKSGEGFRGEHYYESRTGYDDLGRVIRQQTPGGTLTRLVYDSEGRLASIWVGTNDRQATPGDPTGGGASRNNMVVRFSYEYDHGQPGGNGLLTRRTEHVDADPLNDRVTEYTYDYRGWLDETHRSDGTTLFIEKNFYDNQGSVIQMDAYHTSAVAANLTRRMEWRYDFQKRVYRTDKWSVEPGTGEVGYALVSQIWFDGAGNVIRSQGAGSRAFSKVQYDSLNREIHRYLAWNPGSSTLDNDVDLDTVIEQTDSHYDDVGDLLWISQRQRYEDATGTGPLQHSEGAEPKARVSHTAYWYDGIRRPVAEAAYGTNGGAAFHRPAIVPQRSDLVLVHSNRYAADGEPAASIDPAGTETQWENDAAGNQICLVENYRPDVPEDGCEVPHDVNRTTEYRYNADGQLEYLILINPVTGDQVTQWLYGTTLEDSSVARTDLLRTKIYPMADDEAKPELGDGDDGVYERIEYHYNRVGQQTRMKDPNGTIHDYEFNQLGQLLHDRVTTLAAHIDGGVRRISLAYNARRQVETVGSYSSALVGHGTLLNQVKRDYNGFGQMVADWQEHDGAVTGGSPVVGYEFDGDATSNASRLSAMTYPNGRRLDYGYGVANGIDDHLSRLQSIGEDEETLVDYHFAGLARYVRIVYPEPGVELSYLTASDAPDGGSGDPYGGYDRFGRVQQMRWIKTATGEIVDGWQWGFDRASNRTWRKNLVTTSGQDEAYGYDGLYQVIRDAVGTLNTNRTAIGGTPNVEEGFSYDPVGNWLGYRKYEDGETVLDQTRGSNRDNQLVQIDGSSSLLEYDKIGNALKVPPGVGEDWDKCFQPVWDAWNRLVRVKDESGATVQKNAYDGLFRRITKESGGAVAHTYWSSRWKPLEERTGSETTAARSYLWGERPGHRDELVLRDRDTDSSGALDERLYATMDYFSGTAVLSTTGVVQERYAYSAFGERRVMTANFSLRGTSLYDWDFGFQGQFRDAETGGCNYGYRLYSPKLGRWINRDPIGEDGGFNLYKFAANNPVALIDFLGLEECPPCEDCESPYRLCKALAHSAYHIRMRIAKEKYETVRAEISRQADILQRQCPTGTVGIACRALVDESTSNANHINSVNRGVAEVAAEVEYTRDLSECDDKFSKCIIRRVIEKLNRKCK